MNIYSIPIEDTVLVITYLVRPKKIVSLKNELLSNFDYVLHDVYTHFKGLFELLPSILMFTVIARDCGIQQYHEHRVKL
jgi:hypothetical protein